MKILITAGPTREAIDPVRYISNRSSGKMGFALAQAAQERGHEVTLVAGPVALSAPDGVDCVKVVTAAEMFGAVKERIRGQEIAIFAAAVADYRPVDVAPQKIKKGSSRMTIELEKTEDILGSARPAFGFKGVLIGFAAETENLIQNAMTKLQRKMCDMVVANNVAEAGIGFDSDANEVILCTSAQPPLPMRRDTKLEIARVIIERAEELAARKYGKKTPT